MSQIPLDLSTLSNVLAKGDSPPKTRSRTKKTVDTSVRTVTTWFKLPHTFGTCENPECKDDRPYEGDVRHAMCATIDVGINAPKDIAMCRICFLEDFGLDKSATV